MVCDKVVCEKMVCDKVVCEKMVCERWCVTYRPKNKNATQSCGEQVIEIINS